MILRRGHKMLLSGSSKAGKSFLLMELCIAIAEGRPWLGFPCLKGRVLYVNLEIDPASAINRFLKIYGALGIAPAHAEDIVIWNLRGHALPLDRLVPKLIRRIRSQRFDAIILDPIYKVITGDENSASDMGAFCNQFDRICSETGCCAIYCHHHSKGVQGSKRAMDRASGSGVFARDPDAQLDMIQLELSDHVKNNVRDGGATAWRLESSLREFENIEPVDFWFEYPLHRVDETGELSRMPAQGSGEAGLVKNPHHKTAEAAAEDYRLALKVLKKHPRNRIFKKVREECEEFFLSDWFLMLTRLEGKDLMRRIQREEKYNGYNENSGSERISGAGLPAGGAAQQQARPAGGAEQSGHEDHLHPFRPAPRFEPDPLAPGGCDCQNRRHAGGDQRRYRQNGGPAD